MDLGVDTLGGCASVDYQDYAAIRGVRNAASNATPQADEAGSNFSFSARVTSNLIVNGQANPGGGSVLELSSSGTSTGFGVVHGPAAVSDAFTAAANDVIKFNWYATGGRDDFAAVAYIVKTDCSGTSQLLSAFGTSTANMIPAATGTGWQTASFTIPSAGSYQLVFVNGSFDRSGGRALGAQMYVGGLSVGVPQTITFANPGAVVSTVTLNATASSSLAVSYVSATPSICSVTGGVVTVIAAGSCTITASQIGDTTYASAPDVSQTFSVTVGPIAGACGSADGQSFGSQPAVNLCQVGTASAVTSSSGQYAWTCAGQNGGASASCTALWASTGGNATGSVTLPSQASNNNWLLSPAGVTFVQAKGANNSPSTPPPSNYTFPYGLATFDLITGTAGTDATVTINYTEAIPAGAVYMKYGKTEVNGPDRWYQLPSNRVSFSNDRKSITLTLTDGGVGDHDMIANNVIQDPGGPALIAAETIPTLGEWAMIFMASLMAMFGIRRMRRSK